MLVCQSLFGLKQLQQLVFSLICPPQLPLTKELLEVWSAYAHVDNGKLEPRSVKCVFLSYKSGVKGYKLWCPETHKTIISRDVSFYETSMLQGLSITDSGDTSEKKPGMQVEFPIEFETTPEHLSQPNLDMHDEVDSTIQQPSVPPQYTIARDRPMSD